jgi:hypothetical protein
VKGRRSKRESESCRPAKGPRDSRVGFEPGAIRPTFLKEHIAIDANHTLFNAAELQRLLAPAPERAEALGRAGSRALGACGMFLAECMSLAKARWAQLSMGRPVGEALESART